jgi:hypothetical protein
MAVASAEDVAVIHLVWHGAGRAAFVRFLDSYRRHRAGRPHTLVLVFKEVPPEERPHYDALVGDLPHVAVEMPAPCLDIPAYLEVARALTTMRVCLLNSNSEVLADDWLAMLDAVAAAPGVGAASATGSWESHVTSTLDARRQAAIRGQFLPWTQLRKEAEELVQLFSPFPNFHLRTNALVMDRARFVGLPFPWNTGTKTECLVFESGWLGLTHQLVSQGLLPVVVGRDGHVFEKERWPDSHTFRAGDQHNLLVGDNRTRDYQHADAAMRRVLASMAWGPR